MTPARAAPPVQLAAGGLLWQLDVGEPTLAIVHRPRGDWVLPKGGVEAGESLEVAAIREVREETRADAEITGFADTIHFEHDGALEIVAFWHMRPLKVATFEPNDEIDALEWVTPTVAAERLTHDLERGLVASPAMAAIAPRAAKGIRGWYRDATDPSADRLAIALPIVELEMRARDGAWGVTARQALAAAAAANDRGEPEAGWQLVKLADRLQILEADDDQVEARAAALRNESAEKLSSWRRTTVAELVAHAAAPPKPGPKHVGGAGADGDPAAQRRRVLLYEAMRIRDEAADNGYRRLALVRRNRTLLLPVLLGILAALLAVVLAGAVDLDAGGNERGAEFLIAVALLGALGASISAMQSLGQEAGQRMPEALTSAAMTLTRPAVGAAAAVGAFVIAEAGFPKLDTSDAYVLLALAFAAGFSERFIVSLVEGTGKR